MLHVIQAGHEPNTEHSPIQIVAHRSFFIDSSRRDVPAPGRRCEIHRLYDDSANYLILRDASGTDLAFALMRLTNRGRAHSTRCTPIIAGPMPKGTDAVQISCLCLGQRLSSGGRRAARLLIVAALVNYSIEHGIVYFVVVVEASSFLQIARLGLQCEALGSPGQIEGVSVVTFGIRIDPDTPAKLTARYSGSPPARESRALAATVTVS